MINDTIALAREVLYVENLYEIDKAGSFFLAADIGGTNSNFGIFATLKEPATLILSLHYKSKNITDFALLVRQVYDYVLNNYNIKLTQGCIAAAGIVHPSRIYVHPTNLSFDININNILKLCPFKDLLLINDFEAVSLGFSLIKPESIITINKGVHRTHANIGFIGAGTGLGKSILVWNKEYKRYRPVLSEGGHSDVSIYTQEEFRLIEFIYKNYSKCPVSWENILSGSGLQKIYNFLATEKYYPVTDISKEIEQSEINPDRISFYAHKDPRSLDAFKIYVKFYARCAKNFALEILALNGIYIAGGIAAKNVSMFFDPLFIEEFKQCGKQSSYVDNIPVSIISDYNVSLYGAVEAFKLYRLNLI